MSIPHVNRNSLGNLESRYPIPWIERDNCGTAEIELCIQDPEWDKASNADPFNDPIASVHVHVYTREQRDEILKLIRKWNTP